MFKNLIYKFSKVLQKTLICLIIAYQKLISPLLPNRCRFSPSCSQYAKQAIESYGAFKGIWYTIRRLVKCNPLHDGGYDPVPNLRKNRRFK